MEDVDEGGGMDDIMYHGGGMDDQFSCLMGSGRSINQNVRQEEEEKQDLIIEIEKCVDL